MENTAIKGRKLRTENMARLVYDYLQARKETGIYRTASAHEEIGLERYRFYTAMQYLTQKGYIKSLGRQKEGDGFIQRFVIEKEFPITIPPVDIAGIRAANARMAATPVVILTTKTNETEVETPAQTTMDLSGVKTADEMSDVLAVFENLEKAVDRTYGSVESLKEELFVVRQALNAEKNNNAILKNRIMGLTQRINNMK